MPKRPLLSFTPGWTVLDQSWDAAINGQSKPSPKDDDYESPKPTKRRKTTTTKKRAPRKTVRQKYRNQPWTIKKAAALAKVADPPPRYYIGIHGRIGAGKNTAADALMTNSRTEKQLAFVGEFKEGLQKIFGFTEEQLHTQKGKRMVDERYDVSSRQVMQDIGTDYIRKKIRPDFFVFRMREIVDGLSQDIDTVIFTDVRFPEEAAYVKELGGTVIGIRRENDGTEEVSEHESETPLSDDYVNVWLENENGYKKEFEEIVRKYASNFIYV